MKNRQSRVRNCQARLDCEHIGLELSSRAEVHYEQARMEMRKEHMVNYS